MVIVQLYSTRARGVFERVNNLSPKYWNESELPHSGEACSSSLVQTPCCLQEEKMSSAALNAKRPTRVIFFRGDPSEDVVRIVNTYARMLSTAMRMTFTNKKTICSNRDLRRQPVMDSNDRVHYDRHAHRFHRH